MTTIFYSSKKSFLLRKDTEMIKLYFNKEMISRAIDSTSDLYKSRRLTFMFMMLKICNYLDIPFSVLKDIHHNDNGRLVMPDYNIVISYSGDYVFCLISSKKMGFDVEVMNKDISERNIILFSYFLKRKVKGYLSFYKEWTKIESLVKYFGNRGLNDLLFNMKNIEIQKFETLHITFEKRYLIALSGENVSEIKNEMKFKKFN